MTTKQAIHEIVERLSEEKADQLLAYRRDEEPEQYPEEHWSGLRRQRRRLRGATS